MKQPMNPSGRRSLSLGLIFGLLAVAGVAPSQAQTLQADTATVTYRRIFQGSTPEFIEIKVREDGTASADVRQLSQEAAPETFEVGPRVYQRIFALARELRFFQGADLDVHRRVAYLGQKTFRWEKGGEAYETQFNYTLHATASQLQALFEGLAQQQSNLATLEQKLRYDRLGVNDALRQFEADLNQRALPEPERFLGVLERIAADTRLIEVARQRARALAERIRTAQTR
jgi:hypothetical protein